MSQKTVTTCDHCGNEQPQNPLRRAEWVKISGSLANQVARHGELDICSTTCARAVLDERFNLRASPAYVD